MALIGDRTCDWKTSPDPSDQDPVDSSAFTFRAGPFAAALGLSVLLGACSAHQRAGVATADAAAAPAIAANSTDPAAAPATSASPLVQTALSVPVPTSRPSSLEAVATVPVAQHVAAASPRLPSKMKVGKNGSGLASWYGGRFHGRRTANGERFDAYGLTAAHRSFPMPSYVRVTNASNGRSIVVRVNDRGPFHGNRVIDVSKRTADVLGFTGHGVGNVKLDYVGPAPERSEGDGRLLASYQEFGHPTAPAGMQVASLKPVTDAELAAGPSTFGAAYAVASAAVTTSAAALSNSATAVATKAKATVRGMMPSGATDATEAPAAAYAPPQPLIASAPEEIVSPKRKRVVTPTEPALASVAPVVAPSQAVASAASGGADAASRIAQSFESFSIRTGGSVSGEAVR